MDKTTLTTALISSKLEMIIAELKGIRASLKSLADNFDDVVMVVPRTEGDKAINIMKGIRASLRCWLFGHLIMTSYVGTIKKDNRFPIESCLRCGARWRV